MIQLIKYVFILLNLLNIVDSEKYVANYFYQNNDCKDLNFIMYTYENYEVCEVLNNTLCNGYGTYSNTQDCGDNSLENTGKVFKNKEYLYYDIYDSNCINKINSIAIQVGKCISFMDTIYIKINKNAKFYNTANFLDPDCTEEYNYPDITPESNSIFNLSLCTDKIKFYNENGNIDYDINDLKNLNENNNNKNNTKKNNIHLFTYIIILVLLLSNIIN
jgi:hypothetical protein